MIENVKIMIDFKIDLSHFVFTFSACIFQIESRKPNQLKVSLALI